MIRQARPADSVKTAWDYFPTPSLCMTWKQKVGLKPYGQPAIQEWSHQEIPAWSCSIDTDQA